MKHKLTIEQRLTGARKALAKLERMGPRYRGFVAGIKKNIRNLEQYRARGFEFMPYKDLLRPPRLLHQLPQEDNKLRAGVPFRGLALHLAGFHIQGGIQRQCPVTVILETMPFGSPR